MASFGCAGSYKARLRSRWWLCERKELNEADDHVVGRWGNRSRVAGCGSRSQIAVASHKSGRFKAAAAAVELGCYRVSRSLGQERRRESSKKERQQRHGECDRRNKSSRETREQPA